MTPPGRAVTDEQKRAVVERLLAAWLRMPHLRLGQFVCACAARTNIDPFLVEDETLVMQAVEFAAWRISDDAGRGAGALRRAACGGEVMTREEALESGIRRAWHYVSDGAYEADPAPVAQFAVNASRLGAAASDELEGFAVGLQLVAVEVAEIARKRREDEVQPSVVST